MEQTPEHVCTIILGAITLHNMLRTRSVKYGSNYLGKKKHDKRKFHLTSLEHAGGNHDTHAAKDQREEMATYFMGPGKLAHQEKMIWMVCIHMNIWKHLPTIRKGKCKIKETNKEDTLTWKHFNQDHLDIFITTHPSMSSCNTQDVYMNI